MLAFSKICGVAVLDTKTALAAADYYAREKFAAADAIVCATANNYDAELLTCGRHPAHLPNIAYFPNAKG